MNKKQIQIIGKIKAVGDVEGIGTNSIRIAFATNKFSLLSGEPHLTEIYIPASEEDLNIAGSLIGKEVTLTVEGLKKEKERVFEKLENSNEEIQDSPDCG